MMWVSREIFIWVWSSIYAKMIFKWKNNFWVKFPIQIRKLIQNLMLASKGRQMYFSTPALLKWEDVTKTKQLWLDYPTYTLNFLCLTSMHCNQNLILGEKRNSKSGYCLRIHQCCPKLAINLRSNCSIQFKFKFFRKVHYLLKKAHYWKEKI
jgi:hypothetical protein